MLRKESIRISVMTVSQVGRNVADGDKGLIILDSKYMLP